MPKLTCPVPGVRAYLIQVKNGSALGVMGRRSGSALGD